MDLKLPYINPYSFAKALVKDYDLIPSEMWNAHHLRLPEKLACGSIQLFIRKDVHFYRAKWKFSTPTGFYSFDKVGEQNMVDFRVGASGSIQSCCIEGSKKFEWEITEVDGFRIMIPDKYLKSDKNQLREKFEKYCYDTNIVRLQKEILAIDPGESEQSIFLESRMLEFTHFWIDYLNKKDIRNYFDDMSDYHFHCIQNAKLLLAKDMAETPSIREISRKVGLNECDLKRGFRKVFGLPIRQYLIKMKMEHARELVKGSQYSMQEIYDRMGYCNRGHFAELYKKYFGISPLADRMKGST